MWGKKRPKCPDSARMGALDGFSAQFVRSKAVCLPGTTVPLPEVRLAPNSGFVVYFHPVSLASDAQG